MELKKITLLKWNSKNVTVNISHKNCFRNYQFYTDDLIFPNRNFLEFETCNLHSNNSSEIFWDVLMISVTLDEEIICQRVVQIMCNV